MLNLNEQRQICDVKTKENIVSSSNVVTENKKKYNLLSSVCDPNMNCFQIQIYKLLT